MNKFFIIANDEIRQRAAQAVHECPIGSQVTVGEAKKKREQEEKYHAMIGDIAKQCLHVGRPWDVETWKRLLIASFVNVERQNAKAEGREDPFPFSGFSIVALDNSGFVQMGVHSREFTVKQASNFIELLMQFGEENGVIWGDKVCGVTQ